MVLVIADHQVWSQYSKDIILEKVENKKVIFWKSPDGEKVKNFNDYQTAIEFFLDKGIHRNAHLVVIGGGAVSDFSGLIAATILRGIAWSIIPTTLLSMVDASIGGKVGINSKSGKNLIGAFHLPTNVFICTKFLETLPEAEKQSGLGEVLKYGFLDFSIYNLVVKKADMELIIDACAQFKLKITEEDLKEDGNRKILNLGHSFGHALEFIYNLTHGEAVFWGMALVFKVFGNEKNLYDIKALKNALGMPAVTPPWYNKEFPTDKIMTYLSKDKKISAMSSIDLILIEDIGNPKIENKTFEEIQAILETNKDELRKFSF
jgi:3-dehydroquinate synthetase